MDDNSRQMGTIMSASQYESLTGKVDVDFPEYSTPPDEPMKLAQHWLEYATCSGVREPAALTLATVDRVYRVSSRIVAVLTITCEGLKFSSHNTSRKGTDITATGQACGLFYWRELGQQLMVSGQVTEVGVEEANEIWDDRPTPLHYMSAASQQSAPLDSLQALHSAADTLEKAADRIPRPTRFVGYNLRANVVEFWCASSDRLHRRLRYEHDGDKWAWTRLQP